MHDIHEVEVHNEKEVNDIPVDVLQDAVISQNGELPQEYLLLFGEEPVGNTPLWGEEVQSVIASYWNKYIDLGVDKTEKEALQKKYLIPKNIPHLKSPELNPEILASISEAQKKEDKYSSIIQGQIGNGLAALAKGLNRLLSVDENTLMRDLKTEIIPCLIDSGKIFTDVFHMESTRRKYHIEASLNHTVRKIVRESKPDKFLCGMDFAEKFKEAKNHLRTGKELKNAGPNSTNYKRFSGTQSASVANTAKFNVPCNTGSLNYRGPHYKSKMKKPSVNKFQRTSYYQERKGYRK